MERLKGKDGNFYSLDEITPELYVCPAGEERSYHVVQEVVEFTRKGQRISSPRLQKYGQKIFETIMRDSLMKQGYDVKILHNPKEWIAKVEQAQKELAQKREAERKAAEKEALKAEIKAEMEAEKKTKEPKEKKTKK